jgi:hypothetical protein
MRHALTTFPLIISLTACGDDTTPAPPSDAITDTAGPDAEGLDVSSDVEGDAAPDDTGGDVEDVAAPEDIGDASTFSELRVGWCVLQYPPGIDTAPGGEFGPIYGRVFVAGLTDVPREGNAALVSLQGEVGLGRDDGTEPDPSMWTFWPAENARSVDANHEFERVLPVPSGDGVWRYVYRFRVGNDQPWTYCDLNGTDDGFSRDDTAVLTVVTPRPSFCRIQFPTGEIPLTTGDATPSLYGRVFAEGLTGEAAPEPTVIVSEVGYGPPGSTPSDLWEWSAGAFNVHVDNGLDGRLTNDEHLGALAFGAAGTFDWAWRFRIAPYAAWRYCDTEGNDTYQPGAAGRIVVTDPIGEQR